MGRKALSWLVLCAACSQDPAAGGDMAGHVMASATQASTAVPSAVAPRACGSSGQPACPLQAFMKANALVALEARRFDRLGEVLGRVAEMAPPDYPRWRDIALAGAKAAADENLESVRRSCKGCHDAYRAAYRRDHRADVIPGP